MLQIQTHRADCGCFPAGLLLRVRLHGQLVGQRRDLAVVAAAGHAQQHGPEPGGHVRASRCGSPEPGPGPGFFFAWTEVSFFLCIHTELGGVLSRTTRRTTLDMLWGCIYFSELPFHEDLRTFDANASRARTAKDPRNIPRSSELQRAALDGPSSAVVCGGGCA